MAKNKKSEDATVKVGKRKPKGITEEAVVARLMDIFDEAFNNGSFDDTELDRVQSGEGFGCEPNEIELLLKDGSVFVISVSNIRGPR